MSDEVNAHYTQVLMIVKIRQQKQLQLLLKKSVTLFVSLVTKNYFFGTYPSLVVIISILFSRVISFNDTPIFFKL